MAVWTAQKHGIEKQEWSIDDESRWIADGNSFETCECGDLLTESASCEIGSMCPVCRKKWANIPTVGGYWLWDEGGHENPVRLLLTSDGGEVEYVETAKEGTPQYYWEGTSTDKDSMPGKWMRDENQQGAE
jgi:hypothetical protein